MAEIVFDDVWKVYRTAPRRSRTSTSRSTTGSSWCWSAPQDAGRPQRCGWSPAWRRSPVVNPSSVTDGQPGPAPGPRHRDGVPELRPLSPPHRRREHGLRTEAPPRPQGRDQAPGRRGRPDPGARGAPRSPAPGALRRAAPARGDGPGHRAGAPGLPDGRAAVEPRRQAPRSRCGPRSPASSATSR